jgi:hypothetical protein
MRVYQLPENHQFVYQSEFSEEDLLEMGKLGNNIKVTNKSNNKSIATKPKSIVKGVHPKPK